jgi:hypothetical protein
MLRYSPSTVARQHNIKTEIEAGKPPQQAVAIGYSIQRHMRKEHGTATRRKKGTR